MIGPNGCRQPDTESRYTRCQSPVSKGPQPAIMKHKLQTNSFEEHFEDDRKPFCNHPTAPLAFP